MGFGHCGIDWLHSLLDSHKQLLIMPEFSFYRSWKLLQVEKVRNPSEMVSLWEDYFNSPKMQGKDTKQFYNKEESDRFYSKFYELLKINGIGRVNTLWSIHSSYAFAKNIDINKIKSVIVHEHTCFPIFEIIKDFSLPNILMIIRDPRAAIAGSFKGMNKKFPNLPDYYEYYVNCVFEEWLQSCEIWKKYKKNLECQLKIIKNEDLHMNLQKYMSDLSSWLGVDFNDTFLNSTYPSGVPWIPDSCYISRDGQYPDNDTQDTFYAPENIKRRWHAELDPREILMIEFIFNDIMKEFHYKRITQDTYVSRIKGLIYFLLPHRGPGRFKNYPPDNDEFLRVLERLNALQKYKLSNIWAILPIFIKSGIIWMSSILKHIKIYFFPNDRWQRYDNPIIDNTYRNY